MDHVFLCPTFKFLYWEWQIVDAFNLNISFILFDLKYSGEACVQERVVVYSSGNNTIGRYCGRRYYYSVFVSTAPIMLEFHTFQFSSSQFMLQYQVTGTILKTFLHKYKSYKNFGIIENMNFPHPFSWNHIYFMANISHLVWNIFVPKMYILLLKITKVPLAKESVIIFDGPDIHSNQLDIKMNETFIASSFQVLILYLNTQNEDIEMIITNNILKNKMESHQNIYNITGNIKLNSDSLTCVKSISVLCAFKVHVPVDNFINVTSFSLLYYGANAGYCKYGGLSVYDNVKNKMQEVLLLCDSILPGKLNTDPKQVLVSSTQSLFLIFYAYWPYSRIRFNITIKPTTCKGIHILRYV